MMVSEMDIFDLHREVTRIACEVLGHKRSRWKTWEERLPTRYCQQGIARGVKIYQWRSCTRCHITLEGIAPDHTAILVSALKHTYSSEYFEKATGP